MVFDGLICFQWFFSKRIPVYGDRAAALLLVLVLFFQRLQCSLWRPNHQEITSIPKCPKTLLKIVQFSIPSKKQKEQHHTNTKGRTPNKKTSRHNKKSTKKTPPTNKNQTNQKTCSPSSFARSGTSCCYACWCSAPRHSARLGASA